MTGHRSECLRPDVMAGITVTPVAQSGATSTVGPGVCVPAVATNAAASLPTALSTIRKGVHL